MKVLITGMTGMTGSHLAEYLLQRRDGEIHATIRWRSNKENIALFENKVQLHECDLKDPYAVLRLLDKIKPQWIFHLASQSSVATSWNTPRETLMNNITAELNIFEAIRQLKVLDTRVLIAGSSEEYGLVHAHELPVNETTPLRPLSPYGVSKVTQDRLAFQYHKSFGLDVVITRAFNQTGPRQADVFVISNFARQIVEIEAGLNEPIINVGDLTIKRDFTDIRDVVRAYVLALEKCEAGSVYNIGSGRAVSIKQILDRLLGMSKLIIQVKKDSTRVRPSEVPELICNAARFRRKTGWRPEVSLEKSLFDLLEYWRIKLGSRSYNWYLEEKAETVTR